MCSLVPLLVFYDFDADKIISALLASRTATDFEAPEPGLAQHLALFGIYGAALFFVYALKTSTWLRLWWLLLGAIVAVPFIAGGTRHLWLYISLPSVLIVLRGFKGQLDGRRIMGIAAAALIVLVVAQVQFAYRNVGFREVGDVTPQELSQFNTTGQFTALLFAEHLVPSEHEYFMELAEPYFVIHWIPRQLWAGKPIMESWVFYNESYVQGAEYNVTPSVIGQFHLNWGLPGVIFIGGWLGFLTCLADRVLLRLDSDRQRAMFVVVGMFYAFIISSFRFYSPIYFSYFLFGVLAMFLLTRRSGLSHALAKMTPRLAPNPMHSERT
jgi:oligosaccharide repeat unit polymerase